MTRGSGGVFLKDREGTGGEEKEKMSKRPKRKLSTYTHACTLLRFQECRLTKFPMLPRIAGRSKTGGNSSVGM